MPGEPAPLFREPASLFGEPASILREPASLFGEPVSILREPLSILGETASILREPRQLLGEAASLLRQTGQWKAPQCPLSAFPRVLPLFAHFRRASAPRRPEPPERCRHFPASWAQADAQKSASEILSLLRQEIETVLNLQRRDLQGAADQAYSHRDPTNAAQRKAFGLQPDRSLND